MSRPLLLVKNLTKQALWQCDTNFLFTIYIFFSILIKKILSHCHKTWISARKRPKLAQKPLKMAKNSPKSSIFRPKTPENHQKFVTQFCHICVTLVTFVSQNAHFCHIFYIFRQNHFKNINHFLSQNHFCHIFVTLFVTRKSLKISVFNTNP